MKRLTTKRLPPYAFTPGVNPHPYKSEQGHMYGQEEPKVKKIDQTHWQSNQDYLYALDLLNHGYFWESHVWFEALWNEHGRNSLIATLMKAFIKVAAAGVKARQGKQQASLGHLKRAKELFSLSLKHSLLGFKIQSITIEIEKVEKELEEFIADKHRQSRCFHLLAPNFN